MPIPAHNGSQTRLLHLLKTEGPATATALSDDLGITDVAARQHLAVLESAGLVESRKQPPQGRGRPAVLWRLSRAASTQFPDHHAELAVGFINAAREALGEVGLMRIVEVRARDQVTLYRTLMPPKSASLKARVEALARQRDHEGYMAEVRQERPGVYLLIEHHCPICDAAESCRGLCQAELEVFQQALGDDVTIERTSHLLSGDERCVYRISR